MRQTPYSIDLTSLDQAEIVKLGGPTDVRENL